MLALVVFTDAMPVLGAVRAERERHLRLLALLRAPIENDLDSISHAHRARVEMRTEKQRPQQLLELLLLVFLRGRIEMRPDKNGISFSRAFVSDTVKYLKIMIVSLGGMDS